MVQEGSINFSNMDVQSDAGNFSGDKEWRRLKFEAGKSYRIKFIDNEVEMRHRHYNPVEGQAKGYYRCLAHSGYCPVCQAASNGFGGEGKYKLKKAQEMFGANVLVYNTDANGNPTQPLNAEVYFWAFNAKKFVQIRSIQQDWGDITKIDLKLTCADAQAQQFQDVSITNLPQCLYVSDPNFKAQCDAKIAKDKYPLAKMLCKEVDLNEMIKAFGLPQNYYPQGMLAQMPQGQQTVSDIANGTQPMQSVAPQMAPQAQIPPVYPQGGLNYQSSVQPVPMPQGFDQAPVQPVPMPQGFDQSLPFAPAPQQAVSQVQPIAPAPAPVPQPAPEAPVDAFADLESLQNMLG